jgi:hypothetical protein
VKLDDWKLSRNKYDWLGDGIYFWENGLRRAREWADEFVRGPSGIVSAEVELGRCLDLADTEHLILIRQTYFDLVETYRRQGLRMPVNREIRPRSFKTLQMLDGFNRWVYRWVAGVEFNRSVEHKLRYLDSLVINKFIERTDGILQVQTMRYPFEEGEPVFPGSKIRTQSHVQLAVRDVTCIRNISLLEG